MLEEHRSIVTTLMLLLQRGEVKKVAEMLPHGLGATPEFYLNPPFERVNEPTIQKVQDYWIALSPDDRMPLAKNLNMLELSDFARYLMLLEIEDDGWVFRYRFYGQGIVERAGFDMTGKSTADVPSAPDIGLFFTATYRLVLETKKPIYTRHAAPATVSVLCWDRLLLPLFDQEKQKVNRILVVNIPGPWKRAGD